MQLDTEVKSLKGVGPKFGAKLNKLGLETVQDLLFYYPRTYRDFTKITKLSELGSSNIGNSITVRGRIIGIANKKTSRRRFTITEAIVEDGTGSIKVVWFNQPFLQKMLTPGREVVLNGKLNINSYSSELTLESPERTLHPRIEPIYSETEGISSKYISRLIFSVMDSVCDIKEFLPEDLLCHSRSSQEYTILDPRVKPEDDMCGHDLMPIREALINIHEPKNSEMLEKAKRRLAFDELFLIALKSQISKAEIRKENAPKLKYSSSEVEKFIANLPFELTSDQQKSIDQILKDISSTQPMNRLLNGDVGSGKTIVGAVVAYAVVLAGYRVVFMAPTSILANQHYETFCKLFGGKDISVGLFTRERQDNFQFKISNLKSISNSTISKQKRSETLNADIIIGTQALIQNGVELENVGLVIVDEQHRFGVKQRAALQQCSVPSTQLSDEKLETGNRELETKKVRPHFLSMTATPIPRTLHLALFGDLDLSVIREKPKDRKEIKTRLVETFNRNKAYEFVREHLKRGRQAFVICPLIENTGEEKQASTLLEEDRKTVVKEFEKLQKIFPEYKIGMLHGRMKAKEKDEIMSAFSNAELDILVSTSVVEVGVDVPNASIMMIEDAEHFGLAQLHQFRGRVGRGEHQSFCLLFSSTNAPVAMKRLKSLEMTNDGFELAETDLEARGPGDMFGTMQSGTIDLRMASFSDRKLIEEVTDAAKNVVQVDSELSNHSLLKTKLQSFFEAKHME